MVTQFKNGTLIIDKTRNMVMYITGFRKNTREYNVTVIYRDESSIKNTTIVDYAISHFVTVGEYEVYSV